MKQRGISGVVILSAQVDESGGVVAASVVRSVDSKLDDLAVTAVRSWKYQPARFGGRTFGTMVEAIVPFLDGGVLGGVLNTSQPPFNAPTGIAVDRDGSVYVADAGRSLIYKITGTAMAVFAGDGSDGFKGDGGPALSAELNVPYDLAVDESGNLYIADTGNSRIRKITPAGTISTVAGTGVAGWGGEPPITRDKAA